MDGPTEARRSQDAIKHIKLVLMIMDGPGEMGRRGEMGGECRGIWIPAGQPEKPVRNAWEVTSCPSLMGR